MTIHDIQQLVCTRYGISHCDLMSRRRGRLQAVPRQVAMWLSRHTLPHTLPEIGRAFDRDHTTVIAAIRRVEQRMAANPAMHAMMLAWRDSLIAEVAA